MGATVFLLWNKQIKKATLQAHTDSDMIKTIFGSFKIQMGNQRNKVKPCQYWRGFCVLIWQRRDHDERNSESSDGMDGLLSGIRG